ncbi:MAG: DUF5067 domain-containing protein [Ruminococcaceae bacterium]|nr:DUF5067 domain-containing protein [Oscillospiraceae bacterium]
MKKIFCVLLATIMLFALCACNKSEKSNSPDKNDVTETPDGMVIGGCVIRYNDFELLNDEGVDVIAINYTFTNNNDYATSFFLASIYEAKQGDEEIFTRIVFTDEGSLDSMSDSTMEEIGSGESIDVTVTYALADTTTPVTVTFSDIASTVEESHTIEIA